MFGTPPANTAALRIYGCSYEQARQLNGGVKLEAKGSRARRYMDQRKSAIKRGIGWEMTFLEWCQTWVESGKEHLCGVGADRYCMSRKGDVGPYKVGNVRIVTNAENISEARRKAPGGPRTVKGYSKIFRSAGRPYTAKYCGVHLGNFATEDEARAAYLAAVEAQAAKQPLNALPRGGTQRAPLPAGQCAGGLSFSND